MSKQKRATNQCRASARRGFGSEWWVLLSTNAKGVASNTGIIVAMHPTRRGAKRLVDKINAAIRNACKIAHAAGKRGERNPG